MKSLRMQIKTLQDDNKRRGELIDQQRRERDKLISNDNTKTEELLKVKQSLKLAESRIQTFKPSIEPMIQVHQSQLQEHAPLVSAPKSDIHTRQMLNKLKDDLGVKNKELTESLERANVLEFKLKECTARIKVLEARLKKSDSTISTLESENSDVCVVMCMSSCLVENFRSITARYSQICWF